MTRKNNAEKLVITNYDNFKNANFFIKQYFQAQEMLKEVNDFFDSFIQSKLLTASQVRNLSPSYMGNHSDYSSNFIWTLNFISRGLMDKGYDRKIRYVYNDDLNIYESTDKYWKDKDDNMTVEQFSEFKKLLTENCKRICEEIANTIENTEFDCYYILTQDNALEEFIPIASKDTIKFDFQKDSNILIISGSFYRYHEWGGRWGQSESKLEKITKKVLIDRATNNVIKVETKEETVRKGNADGKSYWDHHEDYCISGMTKKSVNTAAFDNVKEVIRHYLYNDAEVHHTWVNNEEAIAKTKKHDLEYIHKHYDERFEKVYKKKLTDEYIKQLEGYRYE